MVVLITGASSGIGRALSEHYVRQRATVAAIARRAPLITVPITGPITVPQAIGGVLVPFKGDVTDRDAMAAIIAEVEQTLGPIDLAIACAGIAEEQSAPDLDLATLERALATNVSGAFNVLVPAARAMRLRGSGHIVAISSLAGEHSLPHMTAYCMSKAALNSGMQGLQLLLRDTGVSVTNICPGFIATAMTAGRVAPARCMSLEQAVARILRAIRQRRRICHFPTVLYLLLRMLCLMPTGMKLRVLTPIFGFFFSGQPLANDTLRSIR